MKGSNFLGTNTQCFELGVMNRGGIKSEEARKLVYDSSKEGEIVRSIGFVLHLEVSGAVGHRS